MSNYLWLQRLTVHAVIGLACLLVLAACDSPTINQTATPTTIHSNRTPLSTPTLHPSTTAAAPPATGNVTLVYDDQMGEVLFLGDTFNSDPNQPTQTWTWNCSAWTHLHPAHEPSIRSAGSYHLSPSSTLPWPGV